MRRCCQWTGIWTGILPTLILAACARAPNPPTAQTATAPMAAMPGMPAVPANLEDWARGAQLFEGLGVFHRQISSTSPQAQQFFDQGSNTVVSGCWTQSSCCPRGRSP